MENNDVQLLKRARHAFKNLIIYGPRPVVRRKLLSADGSYGDMPESMCTWSMLTRRSKHPLTAKRASLNGSPASKLASDPEAHRLQRCFRATQPNFTDSLRDECLLAVRAIKTSLDICEAGAI